MSEYLDRKEDMIGRRFGYLTVVDWYANADRAHPWNKPWRCKCDCGNDVYVGLSDLKNGRVISCGCIMPPQKPKKMCVGDTIYNNPKIRRINNIWHSMKQRCSDSNRKDYHWYGGRGIKVCREWANDFKTFALWSLLNGYDDDLSIDRINNDGDYCPENCRWVTRREQVHNKPGVRLYLINGEEYTLSEACGKYEVCPDSVRRWLADGKTIEEAIQQALSRRRRPWSLERERESRRKRERARSGSRKENEVKSSDTPTV